MKKNKMFFLISLLFLFFGVKTVCKAACTCTCQGIPGESFPANNSEHCRMTVCGLQHPMISCVSPTFMCVCNNNSTHTVNDCFECLNVCSEFLGQKSCGQASTDPQSLPEAETDPQSTPKDTPPAREDVKIADPLGIHGKAKSGQEVQYLIGRIISVMMGLVGSLALLMFVYGGFLWMTAAGNEDRVKKGKDVLLWAVAGLFIIFTSYILVYFVLGSLMGLG